MSTGAVSTAVDQELMRDLVELNLIEEYHWTPEYISSLPYKWIQKHNYMKRMKTASIETKQQQAKFKQTAQGMKPGQKTFREI
jgi:hypothetical protein